MKALDETLLPRLPRLFCEPFVFEDLMDRARSLPGGEEVDPQPVVPLHLQLDVAQLTRHLDQLACALQPERELLGVPGGPVRAVQDCSQRHSITGRTRLCD